MKLNAAQLAAIAAGASIAEVTALAATADPTPEEIAAQAAAAAAEAAAIQAAADEAATAAAAAQAQADADTAAALAAASTPNAVVEHLTAQLATANEAVITARLEAASFKAAADAQDGLLAIAREAVSKMTVALGGSDATAQTLTATTVVTEHARVSGLFKDKFKAGGVAVAAATEVKKPQIDPLFAAAVQSTITK